MAGKPDIKYYKLNDEKRKIVEDNYGLIITLANKIHKRIYCYMEYDDILQLCSESFIKCLKQYDSTKSKLSSYAYQRIISEIYDNLRYTAFKQKMREYSIESFKYEDYYGQVLLDSLLEEKIITNVENFVVDKVYISNLLEDFKLAYGEKAYEIVKLYLFSDLQKAEIGRRFNLSRERIRQYINYFKNFYLKDKEKIAS